MNKKSNKDVNSFESLVGQTILRIEGLERESERIDIFTMEKQISLFHDQDCCEWVRVEDVCGDPNDLIKQYVCEAEVVTNSESHPEGFDALSVESFTWTFYKIRTHGGDLTIRWLGSSNGYYSEEVSCFIKDYSPNISEMPKKYPRSKSLEF